MRTDVLLISEEYLKQRSLVNDNVDASYIAPAIIDAQEIYLQQIIGTKFLRKLYQLVEDNDMDNAPAYKELLEQYIQPYLVYKTQSQLLLAVYAKIRNQGVVNYVDTNTTQMTLADINYLKSDFDGKASFEADRMTRYIIAHATDYPEWGHCDDCSDMHSNPTNTYKCPITL